ncbi:MAG: tRNA pseudouridine(55) synthase TruB, partial [Gammaproteobacteria bacterium]
YRLARTGVTVAREPRRVTIDSLECVRQGEDELELDVICSKGTYVRTLAEDIGKQLGCGAHVTALRRIGVEPYMAARMADLDGLQGRAREGFDALDASLLPLDSALSDWPALTLSAQSATRLGNGMPVRVAQALQAAVIRLYDDRENFVGIGHVLEDGRLAPKRMIRLK